MQLTGSLPSCLLAAPGTLSQLDLSNNNLTGSIPDIIPANSSLYGMALASNNLTGTLPRTLSSASMLSNLELDNNQLEGSIPADFGMGMSLLSTVDLSKNALTGECSTGRQPLFFSKAVAPLHCVANGFHCTADASLPSMACI